MSASTQAVAVRGPIPAEDQARANFYALQARLYASAPDAGLLAAIGGAEDLAVESSDGLAREFGEAWRILKSASAAMGPEAAAQEYFDLFVGVGKSEVSLHAAAYLRSQGGSVLAELRSELARLGLGRRSDVNVYEDHLAAVLETMRVLIAGAPGVAPQSLADQAQFFGPYVAPWAERCCDAIIAAPIANYYRRVAEWTKSFVAIERDSFAIE